MFQIKVEHDSLSIRANIFHVYSICFYEVIQG